MDDSKFLMKLAQRLRRRTAFSSLSRQYLTQRKGEELSDYIYCLLVIIRRRVGSPLAANHAMVWIMKVGLHLIQGAAVTLSYSQEFGPAEPGATKRVLIECSRQIVMTPQTNGSVALPHS